MVKSASSHGLPSHRAPKEALTGPGPSQKLSQAPGQSPSDRPRWHIPSCGTGITGASLASKRRRRKRASQRGRGGRGQGGGSAQLCRCCCEGFFGKNSVATSRAPPPTCGTGRQWLSPKRSSCTCSLFLPGQSVASLSAIFTKSQRHCRFVWQAGYLSPGDDGKGVSRSSTRNQQLPPCLLSVLPAW